MKKFFKYHKFNNESLKIIEYANNIIDEYQHQGYDLTLRQLYYQFVAKDLLSNSQKSYNKLSRIINNARLNGDIDWDAIEDRTRGVKRNSHWNNPADIINSVSYAYQINTRQNQDYYIEVWVEKEALAGIVNRICRYLDIAWFACRGYVSQTAMYEAANRFKRYKNSILLYLGDHDPSGIDITRDINERLNETFMLSRVDVKRIALNMDQVDEYNPPPNPAKLSDSRCDFYISRYGNLSWELDALNPNTLSNLIENEVNKYTNKRLQDEYIKLQNEQQKILRKCSLNWDKIESELKDE